VEAEAAAVTEPVAEFSAVEEAKAAEASELEADVKVEEEEEDVSALKRVMVFFRTQTRTAEGFAKAIAEEALVELEAAPVVAVKDAPAVEGGVLKSAGAPLIAVEACIERLRKEKELMAPFEEEAPVEIDATAVVTEGAAKPEPVPAPVEADAPIAVDEKQLSAPGEE
jgi:hypothetical protein